MSNITLIRSDAGDGSWSLHSSTILESGDEMAVSDSLLASGEADWDEALNDWSRPTAADYAAAENALSGRA